jgi:hypothetical protein
VTNLPLVIQWILPMLAADAGRTRAQTLLAIQGAGPDLVRRHLAGIDAALGPSGPGTAGVGDLIRKAEEAVSTSRPTRKRQHVISQVVLRRFVEDIPPGGRQLARFDLAASRIGLTGTNGVGYVDDFVPVDSEATESLWQEVETRLPDAITAALNGTAVTSPVHLSALRRAVGLHFARNPQSLTVHNQSYADAIQGHIDQSVGTVLAAEAFRRRYGLVPAGPEGRRIGAETAVGRLVQLHTDGGLFRLSVQRLYEMVCDRFDATGIGVITPANPSKEFLLGDIPAVTVNRGTGAAGVAQGVTVGNADEIFMPLTPRLIVSVGSLTGTRSVSDAEVDHYNEIQARVAQDYVVHRPGANFTASILAWRP